jgi:hypothetical protein
VIIFYEPGNLRRLDEARIGGNFFSCSRKSQSESIEKSSSLVVNIWISIKDVGRKQRRAWEKDAVWGKKDEQGDDDGKARPVRRIVIPAWSKWTDRCYTICPTISY